MNRTYRILTALLGLMSLTGVVVNAQAPMVLSVSPSQNDVSAPLSSVVAVTFDRAMNSGTFNFGTFVVRSHLTGLMSGSYQYQSPSYSATFTPSRSFLPGEVVTVTLSDSVRSSGGVPMEHGYSWTFAAALSAGDKFLFDSTYSLDTYPRYIVAAHLNNDNYIDLAIADSADNSISILTGVGDGTFAVGATYPVAAGPTEIVAVDVDKIHGIDLVVACRGTDSVSVLLSSGSNTFLPAVKYFCGSQPYSITVADLDNDPWPDIAVADFSNNRIWVLSNLSWGTFDAPQYFSLGSSGGFAPCSIVAGDIDDDGLVDLLTANYWSNNLSTLKNDGAGGFSVCASPVTGTHPQALSIADLDGDGDVDLAVATTVPNRVEVLLNQGGCVFNSTGSVGVGGSPFCIRTADVDANGKLDLVVTSGADSTCTVLMNKSDGQFSANWTYKCDGTPQALCAGDFNGDGMSDIVTVNSNPYGMSVYLNRFFPRVASTVPVQNELKVDPNGDVAVTFSVGMNSGSFPGDPPALTVSSSASGPHAGTITYVDGTRTATFGHPSTEFHAGELVTAFLRKGVQSSSQVAVDSSFSWSFTVASERGDILQGRTAYQVGAGPYEITSADFNRDGFIDLATCNKNSNNVMLLYNDGAGAFLPPQPLDVDSFPVSIVAADLDGNGLLDLATANENSDNISVLLNNGDGSFDTQRIFPTGSYVSPVSITSGDLNGDGHIDLAIAERDNNAVLIMINDGDSTFTPLDDIAVGSSPQALCVGDLDNDGDLDLATANSGSNNVSVLWNNGMASFTSQEVPCVSGATRPFGICLGDLDNDGRLDIIAADSGSNDVSILGNEGGASFVDGGRFTVGSTPEYVSTADMNGDGRPDILAANKLSNAVSVLFNLGNGDFAPATNYPVGARPFSLTASDFDNDGDIDLATAQLGTNQYFENDSISVFYNRSFTYVDSIQPQANELAAPSTTNITIGFTHAMDSATVNDSTVTVIGSLTGARNCTVTYNGALNNFTLNPVSDFLAGEHVSVIVTDGIYSSEHFPLDAARTWSFTTAVAEGGGGFAAQPTAYPCGTLPWSVRVADLDQDNSLDFVVANQTTNNVSIYFNQGDGTYSTGPVYTVGAGPRCVAVADLNYDGFPDIATANFSAGSISVLLNGKDGTFAAPTDYPLSPVPAGPTSLVAVDMDCDGDLDLVAANERANSITVLTNGGYGDFNSSQANYPVGRTPRSIESGDFDDDGYADIVTIGSDADSITVLWNNGLGSLGDRRDYLILAGGAPRSIVAADLDGDGGLDLAIANEDADNISIMHNSGDGTFVNGGNFGVGESPFAIAAGDFDGDRDIDLATADFFGNTVSFLLNNQGTGSFLPKYSVALTGSMPTAISVGDLDGDADLDLVMGVTNPGSVEVLLNVKNAGSVCCSQRVGDANGAGGDEPTIGDVSVMIDARFISGACEGIIGCLAEADINQSGGVEPTCDDITIGDISILIDYLFITGPSLGLPACL